MARVEELGQLEIAGFKIPVTKVRVSSRFLPDFTIDLTKPSTKGGILNVLRPKVTFLLEGNIAYSIGVDQPLRREDPRIFLKDTWFDAISKSGVIPTVIIFALVGFIGYRLLQ